MEGRLIRRWLMGASWLAALTTIGCGGSERTPVAASPLPFVIAGTATLLDGQFDVYAAPVQVTASATMSGQPPCRGTGTTIDGSFRLELPSTCFGENQAVYLSVGGVSSCVSVPFISGGRADVQLLGRPGSFCGMVLKGRAGLSGLGRYDGYHAVFVGAWGTPTRENFCVQTLANEGGYFTLLVPPSCFAEGAPAYLTSGGIYACVSVPYERAVIRRNLDLIADWYRPCR